MTPALPSGFEVPKVGLDRATTSGTPGSSFGHHCIKRFELDRIAKRRTGAMRLDVVHISRLDTRHAECFAQHRLLGGAVRDRQAAARAILVDRRTANDRENRIALRNRVRQPLEREHAAAFGSHETIRRRIEGLAPAVRRHHSPLAERHIRVRIRMLFTPPASARLLSPSRRLWQAR